MSKAFTKEDSGDASDADLDAAEASAEASDEEVLPAGTKNYLTPAGAAALQAELSQLLHVERPQVVHTVSWAASNGDRSENGDYIYGKRRLREIDRRVRFLTKRLERAEIVDPLTQPIDRVVFGVWVKVETETGPRSYQIVGVDETDVARGRISWRSPMARVLLSTRVGDVVTFHSPKGEEELEVVAIWRADNS